MQRLACLLLAAVSFNVYSQALDELEAIEDYNKKIQSAQMVSPMSGDSFGESVSLYDGTVTFSATDIDVPGNSGLPVQLSRYFKVMNRRGEYGLPGLADWELDTPRVYGEFYVTKGWKTKSASPYSRCSIPAIADAAALINGSENNGTIHDIWHGYHMHLPGSGDQEMLVSPDAKVPAIQDGGTYPWITRDFTRIGCLASTKNGYPGEGFVALTQDGTKYYFDHAITHPIKGYKVGQPPAVSFVGRTRVHLMATQVVDRFGNWVKYHYSGDFLTSIEGSDGRLISLTYVDGRLASATTNGRTWTYAYEWSQAYPTLTGAYRLRTVQLPDASAWGYRVEGTLMPSREPPPDGGQNTSCRSETDRLDGSFSMSVDAPWGATATFGFTHARLYRGHTPIHPCDTPPGVPELLPYIPHFFDGYIVGSKTVTGPALTPAVWSYAIGQGTKSIYTTGGPNDPCTGCTPSKTTTVTAPDGVKTQHEFGILYGLNEGRLLSTTVKDAAGATASTSTSTYVTDTEVAAQKFPAQVGSTLLHLPNALANRIRPVKQSVLAQDGVTYTTMIDAGCDGVLCFDALGRTLRKTASNTLGYSKTDATSYHDNYTRWVLGQVAQVTNLNTTPNLIVSRTEYDAASVLPLRRYAPGTAASPGALVQTVDYNADGTVQTIKDGNNFTTVLSGWHRGIPGSIHYPATPDSPSGAVESAVIDNNGWVRSVTDEMGFATGYDYDAMGRLKTITYPTGDAVSYNNWNGTFASVKTADWRPPGVMDGQWVRTEWQGNLRRFTYMDALWRPVLSYEYDESSQAATLRATRTQYDPAGRTAFVSYPHNTITPPAQGAWTTYDALGRATAVSQDSEHGVLTTLTEYLANHRTRVTNPRGFQSVTSYQVFGSPSLDRPMSIQHPEGAFTDITRDIFGKPLSLTRRNADSSLSVTRRYVYQLDQQLCKTIEPETGISIMGYDNAGNLVRSAAGLAGLGDITQCNAADAWASGRMVQRTYDARNRLTNLYFPDGRGNQSWSYTKDGLPSQVITYNASSSGDAVTNSYSYNRRRLLEGEAISQSTPATGAQTRSFGYGYDSNGSLALHSYPTGTLVQYEPNALGQATRAGSYATGVQYYPNGGIKQFTYGNGIAHTMQQNARQLPTRSIDTGVMDLDTRFDVNGNVSDIYDVARGGYYNRHMQYDGLDRLTAAGSWVFGGDGWHRFTYDALDNMTSWTLAGVKDYSQYIYDASNRLGNIKNSGGATIVGFGYDVQGNLQNKNGQQFVFDYGNRLRSAVNKEDYRYDGHGRRVLSTAAQGEILSLYDMGGVLRRQEDARQGKHTDYIYLSGSLVARVNTVVAPGTPLLTVPGYSTAGTYDVQWTAITAASHYELQQQANGGAWQAAYSGSSLSLGRSGMASGTYGYRVRACNPSACGSWSGTASVTVELAPASAPSLSVPGTALNGNYTVSWTGVSGATSYQLEQNTNGGAWTSAYSGAAGSQSYASVPAATYGYRIRACNPAGCSGWSASASVVVIYPPAGVATVSATPTLSNTGSYTVSWTGVSGATTYQLEESALGGGWAVVLNQPVAGWSASGKSAGNYLYRVTACNSAGCGATSSSVTVQVVLPPTQAPTVSVPGSLLVDNYTVSWTAVGAATSYHLEERINGGGWTLVHDAAGASKAFAGKTNATYGYRARGCNVGGCGPWSAEASTVVNVPPAIPATPTGLQVSRHFDDSTTPGKWVADLNWSSSYGSTYYEFQEKRGTAAPTTFTAPASPTWYRRQNVGSSVALTYWIRACSANGCSAWSAGVSP
jgi:YD repeat-containing protein